MYSDSCRARRPGSVVARRCGLGDAGEDVVSLPFREPVENQVASARAISRAALPSADRARPGAPLLRTARDRAGIGRCRGEDCGGNRFARRELHGQAPKHSANHTGRSRAAATRMKRRTRAADLPKRRNRPRDFARKLCPSRRARLGRSRPSRKARGRASVPGISPPRGRFLRTENRAAG